MNQSYSINLRNHPRTIWSGNRWRIWSMLQCYMLHAQCIDIRYAVVTCVWLHNWIPFTYIFFLLELSNFDIDVHIAHQYSQYLEKIPACAFSYKAPVCVVCTKQPFCLRACFAELQICLTDQTDMLSCLVHMQRIFRSCCVYECQFDGQVFIVNIVHNTLISELKSTAAWCGWAQLVVVRGGCRPSGERWPAELQSCHGMQYLHTTTVRTQQLSANHSQHHSEEASQSQPYNLRAIKWISIKWQWLWQCS